MVSFRKRSNASTPSTESTDAEKLLAKKSKRGLFGRNKNNNDRSDGDQVAAPKSARNLSPFKRRKNDVEQAAAAAEPSARRVTMTKARSTPGGKNTKSSRGLSPFKRRFNKEADQINQTPPVTPEKATDDADDSPLQVKVVTVKAQSTPGRAKVNGETEEEEDVTVMSDLTDNRTYKRLADYKQSLAKEQEAAAAAAAIAADAELAAIPEEQGVANVKARMEHVQAAQAGGTASSTSQSKGVCGDGDDNLNPVAYLLSVMDHACKPPQMGAQGGINKSYSFVPEWGMAPSRDERDKRAMLSDEEDDNDGDDDTTRQGPSPTPQQQQHQAVKDEVHENFEMVLEDLQSTEDVLALKKQQQRNWMGAMNFRRNGDKEGNHQEAGVDQQDKANPPPPPPRQVPSTIKKTGKNRANVSPLTVEEEKKEDDMMEEEPAKSGARKMGNKLLKSFRRLKNLKGDLPPVTEDEEYETGPSETTELQVRVPDNMKTLTEQDLIGDQVVQDIYRDLEASVGSDDDVSLPDVVQPEKSEPKRVEEQKERASSPQPQSVMDSTIPSKDQTYDDDESTNVDGEPPASNMISSFMSLLTGSNYKELPDEVRDIPEKGDIPKSKSWVDQFRLTMSEDTHEAHTTPAEKIDRQRSAPYKEMNHKHRKTKQMWREASDPKTGRSYYYHRITREVTWKKPQEMIDFEEQEAQEKDGHRQLVSVLSDGDLFAAAQRTKRGEAEMRKKNARDFDPRVWSTKEEVVRLLQTMAPPDGRSVEQVLKQYEGREEVLLQQLREMKAAKPFDEPVADDDEDTVPSQRAVPPSRSKSVPRTRSTPAVIKKANSFKKNLSFGRRSPKGDTEDGTKTPKRGEVKRPDPEQVTPRMPGGKAKGQVNDAERKSTSVPVNTAQSEESAKPLEGKKIKKPDSPTRNVARAVRARLAARRARDAATQAETATRAKNQAAPLEPEGLEQPQEDEIEEAELNMNSSRRSDKESGALERAEPDPSTSAALHSSPVSISGRVRTSGSGVTKISEKTEVIRNTTKRSPLGTLGELRSTASDATSLSSTGLEPRLAVATTTATSTLPIPGKITAPRTRELMVEEFSSLGDRAYKAEVYDKKRTVRAGRFGTTGTRRRKPFTTPSPHYHDGDDSTKTDSVSALSMEDTKPNYPIPPQFGSKGGVDDARRRALDDAIAREDWDLAAALSDAMRTVKTQPLLRPQHPAGWKQSELDRFISQNDWDAVAHYIATVRAKTKKPAAANILNGVSPRSASVGRAPINAVDALTPPPNTRRLTRRRNQSPELFDETDELMGGNPKKRFGAKSQLQHNDIQSESSYDSEESSYYSDDYSSSSSYSEPSRGKNRYRYASKHSRPIKNKKGGGRPKEFAC